MIGDNGSSAGDLQANFTKYEYILLRLMNEIFKIIIPSYLQKIVLFFK